jgi:hypothetical protein
MVCGDEPAVRRARPPRWDDVPPGLFFQDAFAEGLRGERPANFGAEGTGEQQAARPPQTPPPTQAKVRWSERVSAGTLEDEIKAIRGRLAQALEDPRDFQAQGHGLIRPSLTTAAIVFAVIDQFDGQVRWKDDARAARDRFALAAENARAGSVQVTRQVAERAQELEDLIRGGRLSGAGAEPDQGWPEFADRQMLMQRLEAGTESTLTPSVATPADVQQHREALLHESELTAMFARVLVQPDMPDADDATYRTWCEQLERAALDLRQAVQGGDAAAAERALRNMKAQCAACHEAYRG